MSLLQCKQIALPRPVARAHASPRYPTLSLEEEGSPMRSQRPLARALSPLGPSAEVWKSLNLREELPAFSTSSLDAMAM